MRFEAVRTLKKSYCRADRTFVNTDTEPSFLKFRGAILFCEASSEMIITIRMTINAGRAWHVVLVGITFMARLFASA